MEELPFKRLNAQNWLEVDPVLGILPWPRAHGPSGEASPDAMAAFVMEPQLSERVPAEVRALYEVARGAMCYGFFFHPLYTLAAEQLFRVAETAVSHRCKATASQQRFRGFREKIDFLVRSGSIDANNAGRWHAIRSLRNRASHPTDQEIWPPAMALDALTLVAELSNELFIEVQPP